MKKLLLASLATGAGALIAPPILYLLGETRTFEFLYPVSYLSIIALGVLWLGFLVRAWYLYGRYGLWLLIGAPLVIAWPTFMGLVVWSCVSGGGCP